MFNSIHLTRNKVEVNGVVKLKKDAEKDFLKDKTMHLQLLFGQANRQDEPNDKKATSVVDVTLNHNLDGRLSKDALSQQLSALGLMHIIKCTQMHKRQRR